MNTTKSERVKKILEILKNNPNKLFTCKSLAEKYIETYPEEITKKRERKKG